MMQKYEIQGGVFEAGKVQAYQRCGNTAGYPIALIEVGGQQYECPIGIKGLEIGDYLVKAGTGEFAMMPAAEFNKVATLVEDAMGGTYKSGGKIDMGSASTVDRQLGVGGAVQAEPANTDGAEKADDKAPFDVD